MNDLAAFLEGAGIDHRTTEAALQVDSALQKWRRRFNKRELGTAALDAFGLTDQIDLAQLDVLFAIAPQVDSQENALEETMVATIATRLRIDPSRASRLVSDLISKDLAQRAVSQQDARRTIVQLTDSGQRLVEAARRFKFLVLGDFLSGWTDEEIAAFVPLLARFVEWTDEAASIGEARFAREISDIKQRMQDSSKD